MDPRKDPRRAGAALGPAWAEYLWELAVLILAVAKFPHQVVGAVAAVYVVRSVVPFAAAHFAAGLDGWPLARAWHRLLIGLALASAFALIVGGPAWWLAVVALEFGHSLVKPVGRKVIYAGLDGDRRRALITWLGTAENLAMPLTYAVMLAVGPVVGVAIMIASYGGLALRVPAGLGAVPVGARTPSTPKPSWARLWATTTQAQPAARRALTGLLPIAALLAPLNPLSAILVHSRFHAPEAWVGVLFAGLSVGTILGYRIADRLPARRSIPLMVAGIVGLAFAPSLIVGGLAFAMVGVGFGGFMSGQRQIIATQIPDAIRGQIQLIRQAAIAAATIVGTLAVLGAWAIAPDLAWSLLIIGGMIWMIQSLFGSLQAKLIAAAAAVLIVVGIFALSQGASSTPAGTWVGTVHWEAGDTGYDTVSLHSAGSNSYVGRWTDQEPGSGKTALSASASPGPNGTWVLTGGESFLGSFSLAGQIHGNTWRGISDGLGAQGSFVLHRK